MTPVDWLTAGTAVFIFGMVWLRTRMHYRRGRERLLLTRAGRIYFAALLGVLVLGWLVAPAAGHAPWPAAASPPTPAARAAAGGAPAWACRGEHPHARARRVVARHLLPLHPAASCLEGAEGRGIQGSPRGPTQTARTAPPPP